MGILDTIIAPVRWPAPKEDLNSAGDCLGSHHHDAPVRVYSGAVQNSVGSGLGFGPRMKGKHPQCGCAVGWCSSSADLIMITNLAKREAEQRLIIMLPGSGEILGFGAKFVFLARFDLHWPLCLVCLCVFRDIWSLKIATWHLDCQ